MSVCVCVCHTLGGGEPVPATVGWYKPRRVEDKCDARNLMTAMITVRMQPPPQSKHVPMIFHAWVVFDESSFGDNIFNECALMLDRQGSNIS